MLAYKKIKLNHIEAFHAEEREKAAMILCIHQFLQASKDFFFFFFFLENAIYEQSLKHRIDRTELGPTESSHQIGRASCRERVF